MIAAANRYRGRFAPSPTGPLHFGSLVSAMASFMQARSNGGDWYLRIEDLDPPREQPGAADAICRTLEALGLYWDGPIWYQHERHKEYQAALDRLANAGVVYPCGCSRREIADSSIRGIDGPVYPGTCRDGLRASGTPRAFRVRSGDRVLAFDDRWRGKIERSLARDYGDFVLRRADGLIAYQLAVVVDDAAQGITEVVRGEDLLESTPRQIYLQRLLGIATPRYAHHPVVLNEDGQKLSKQTFAKPIDTRVDVFPLLRQALQFLGQSVDWTDDCDWRDFWRIAVEHWNPVCVRRNVRP